MGLGMGAIKLHKDSKEDDLRLTLGKIGFFLMKDEMTQVNMDFSEDICYLGAEDMQEAIRKGKPAGLKHLGNWSTVYQGLSQLTDQQKKSWFGFDHFYSDLAFPEALPIVFSNPVGRLFDIGGNTAKWAIACCKFNPDVKVSIIDLPGQTAVAEKNAKAFLDGKTERCVVKSKSAQKGFVELNLEVRLKDDNTDFVNTLSEMEGVQSAVLVSYNGDYMG